MTGPIEFLDDAPVEPAEERPPPRRARTWPLMLVAAVVAATIGVVVLRNDSTPPHPTQAAAAPTVHPAPVNEPGPESLPPLVDRAANVPVHDPLMPRVFHWAHGSLVTAGQYAHASCPHTDRADPVVSALRSFTRVAPKFHVRDSATVMHGRNRLCAVQFRAVDGPTTMIVLVTRSTGAGVQTDEAMLSGQYVQYVSATIDGWSVLAGTSGPRAHHTRWQLLALIATDHGLRW